VDKIFKFIFVLMDMDFDPSTTEADPSEEEMIERGINSADDLREFWEEYHLDYEDWLEGKGKSRFDWEGITVIRIEHYDMDSAAIYGRSEAFHQGLSNLDTINVILSDEAEGVYVPRHCLARVRREA